MFSRKTINNLKKLMGISDWSLFQKKMHKDFGKLLYRKKYSADDIVTKMKVMGMSPGDVIFIHASMKEFYNYKGTAIELIEKILDYLGPDGTLVMPAYPSKKNISDSNEISFDVRNTPTAAGYLAETFRKMPGVKRSINLQHSACAIGKYADYLISEHHLSKTCWDEKSPYYKLTIVGAKVFSLGLPYFLTTTIHCTDSLLYGKYEYYNQFFDKEITYKYVDAEGNVGTHTMRTNSTERRRDKKKMIKKYFAKEEFHFTYLSNLRIEMVSAKYTHDRFMELAEKGIVMYSMPDPKQYSWEPLK